MFSSDNTPYEKVGDKEPVSIADEVPFEIPESWEWVRLASVFSVLNGDRGKNYPAKSTLSKTGIPFISALNLDGKTVVDDDNLLCLSEVQYEKLGNGKLVKNDIVVCIRGSLGKHGRFPFDKGAIASSLVILRPHSNVAQLSDYIMMYLDSPLFFEEIKKYDNGTAQPNLAAKSLEQFFIPVPPATEQQRILRKLAILEPYIAKYQNAFEELDTLNASFPEALKKSILQLAVQGKLVPQDPSDEPAGMLLERIRAEKECLIAEGKIKRDKNESVIYRRDNSHYEKLGSEERCIDEEIPFEIPDSWEWVRLGSVCIVARGGSPRPIKDYLTESEDGINWIKIGDTDKGGKYINSTKEKIIPDGMRKSRFVHAGDFLLTNSMSFGRPYILNVDGCIHDGWLVLSDYQSVYYRDFLYYMLSSSFAYSQFCGVVSGAVVKNLNSDKVATALFPLPPIAEQSRIVIEIESLLTIIDSL